MMTVDDRRGSGELVAALKQHGVPVRVKRMKFADFRFRSGPGYNLETGESVLVGIERKKTDELLGAVQDSRFRRRQLQGMLTKYRSHAWLLAEGVTEPNREGILFKGKPITTKDRRRMILLYEAGFGRDRHLYHNHMAFQATIQAKCRMLYMRTCSEEETVGWLASIYRWYQKPYKNHKAAYVVDETKPDGAVLSADTWQRRVIAQFPFVGWERSKIVIKFMKDHGFSLRFMVNQPASVWKDALGFKEGTTIARTVDDYLGAVDDRP